MTERPTEQTHPRLTGLGAPGADSGESRPDYRAAAPSAPTLPPMPRPEPRSSEPSLSERLQQKLSSVRQAATPSAPAASAAPSSTQSAAPDETTVRPDAQAPTMSPTAPAPVAPQTHQAPILPPPPADLQPSRGPAPTRQTQKARAVRPGRVKRPPRRARLRLTRIDPWSVMKTAFLLSIALGVVTIVSVLMVWSVLGAAGVWDSINTTVRDIVGDQADSPFTIQNYLGTDRVIGFTMLVAVIDVVLLTALATLAAFLYNMAAALLGGIDITLVEDEH